MSMEREVVKDILTGIESVRARIIQADAEGNYTLLVELREDLLALEHELVKHTKKLVEELEKAA